MIAATMLRVSRRMLPDGRRTAGVLYAHFDMWLNVRILHRLPTNAIWATQGGMHRDWMLGCFSSSEVRWKANGPGMLGKYLLSSHPKGGVCPAVPLPAAFASNSSATLDKCCYGWSDLFYVPSGALPAFAQISDALSTLHHEIATLSLIHI